MKKNAESDKLKNENSNFILLPISSLDPEIIVKTETEPTINYNNELTLDLDPTMPAPLTDFQLQNPNNTGFQNDVKIKIEDSNETVTDAFDSFTFDFSNPGFNFAASSQELAELNDPSIIKEEQESTTELTLKTNLASSFSENACSISTVKTKNEIQNGPEDVKLFGWSLDLDETGNRNTVTNNNNSNLIQSDLFRLRFRPQQSQNYHNPYVLLTKLTSKEVYNTTVNQTSLKIIKSEPKSEDFCDPESLFIKRRPSRKQKLEKRKVLADLLECILCSKKYASILELKIHVGICSLYNENRDRFCVACNKLFSTALIFKRHNINIHLPKEEKAQLPHFKCKMCPRDFLQKGTLKRHIHEFHKNKEEQFRPFKCHVCDKPFLRSHHLAEHLVTHTEEKNYKCTEPSCGRAFNHRNHLRDHMASHTNVRPYFCPELNCGKTYKTQKHLRQHTRTSHSRAHGIAERNKTHKERKPRRKRTKKVAVEEKLVIKTELKMEIKSEIE